MEKILISGSTGVLGRRVVRVLRQLTGEERVVPFFGDISNYDSVEAFFSRHQDKSFTALIHLAAVVSARAVSQDPLSAQAVNVAGTTNLLSKFWSSNPVAHVTYVSSSHVYASSSTLINENSLVSPISLYGRTKLEGEAEAIRLTIQNGGTLCIARLFSFFSADQDPDFLYPALMRRVRVHDASSKFRLPGWNNTRDFSTADEMAATVSRLSLERVCGVVNIGGGSAETVGEFARRVTGRDLEFSDEDFDPDSTSLVADVSRLRSLLPNVSQTIY